MNKSNHKNNKKETVANTSIFSLYTMLSRLLGLARDSLKAYAFGTSAYAVAFDIAFRIPNMLRNLVAEGALSQSFLPIYDQYKHKDIKEAHLASGIVITLFTIILSVLSLIVWFLTPILLPYLLSELKNDIHLSNLTIELTRILFPYILLMSLISIYMAIQYSHGLFWAASVGPALLNGVVIVTFGGYLWYAKHFQDNIPDAEYLIYLFSYTTILAAIVQLIFQVLVTRRHNTSPRFSFKFKHPVVKNLYNMMLPASLGSAVQELAQLIDIFLATSVSYIIPGAVAALTYSHRLIHLPMGIFGIAISTASMPQFSRLFVEKRVDEFKESIWTAIGLNFFLILPAAIGMVIYAVPIIGLLFERGEFDKNSTHITAIALIYYAPGILAFSLQKLFMSSMYAQKNSKDPAMITIGVLIINIALCLILMKYLYHAGLALASTIAGFAGCVIYLQRLYKAGYFSFTKDKLFDVGKIILINLILGTLMLSMFFYFSHLSYIRQLLIAMPVSILSYLFLAHIFNISEWHLFLNIFYRKKRRNNNS
ncbi:MAG: murein biosynthesis integral membrane protein MurJ [Spirochaetia bacterium]|nr:murein biosynthesis integral membrane protein MurJ [Spirochaetia bacterium]